MSPRRLLPTDSPFIVSLADATALVESETSNTTGASARIASDELFRASQVRPEITFVFPANSHFSLERIWQYRRLSNEVRQLSIQAVLVNS